LPRHDAHHTWSGMMRPILLPLYSVNQRLPSGPVVISIGRLFERGNSVIVPLVLMRKCVPGANEEHPRRDRGFLASQTPIRTKNPCPRSPTAPFHTRQTPTRTKTPFPLPSLEKPERGRTGVSRLPPGRFWRGNPCPYVNVPPLPLEQIFCRGESSDRGKPQYHLDKTNGPP